MAAGGKRGALEWVVALGLVAGLGGGGWFAWQKFGPPQAGSARRVEDRPKANGDPATKADAPGTVPTLSPESSSNSTSGDVEVKPAPSEPATELQPEASDVASVPGEEEPEDESVPDRGSDPTAEPVEEEGPASGEIASAAGAPAEDISLPQVLPGDPTPTPIPEVRFEDLPEPAPRPDWPGNDLNVSVPTQGLVLPEHPVEVASDRLLVLLQTDATEQEFLDSFGRGPNRPKILGRIPSLRLLILAAAESELKALHQSWGQLESVRAVYFDEILVAAQGDPALDSADAQDDWPVRAMSVHRAWDRTRGDPRSVLAILDEAPDSEHPELKGKLVAGWSVVKRGPLEGSEGQEHATAMGILAAGRARNGFGSAGAAPDARILPVEVARGGKSSLSLVLAGLDRAVATEAGVVLLAYEPAWAPALLESWQRSTTRPEAERILGDWRHQGRPLAEVLGQRLADDAAVLVLPAGNRGIPADWIPWAQPAESLVIGGAGQDGIRSAESADGRLVRALAPGAGVPIALRREAPETSELRSGTSYAAANAAGVFALLRAQSPGIGGVRIRDLIEKSLEAGASGPAMLAADRLLELPTGRPALCGSGEGLIPSLARRLSEFGAGDEEQIRLVAGLEEVLTEAQARGPSALASGLEEAEAVLLTSQSGKKVNSGHLRSGSWYFLCCRGTGHLSLVGAIGKWQGRELRRDFRVFELGDADLTPRRGVFFSEGGWGEGKAAQRWEGQEGVQESLAQTGVVPQSLLEATQKGESLPAGRKIGVELRAGGAKPLQFDLNGRQVEQSGRTIEVVAGVGSGQETTVLRYGVLESSKWPLLIQVEDPRKSGAVKPFSVFALRCF